MNYFLNSVIYFLVSSILVTCRGSRILDGYPTGYISDCPGSTKVARISNHSLKHLKIVVLGDGNYRTANKTGYNYFQMKELGQSTDFSNKIVLYMDGYLDSVNFFSPPMMGIAYKQLGYTVWLLEYNRFATVSFPLSARLIRPVGKHVGEMLAKLTKFGLNPKKFEITGDSFGGQGISFIAKNYQRLTGMNISLLTSLDPSGPCFRNLGPNERLDRSDADFVTVVHTNIDGFGMATNMGHVDFYVNGGEYQISDLAFIPCASTCSHVRAFFLWISALKHPNSFIAMQCDSIQDARDKNCYDRKPFVSNLLGPKVDRSKQGIYYLPTYNYYPYGMGEDGLKYDNEPYRNEMEKANTEDVIEV